MNLYIPYLFFSGIFILYSKDFVSFGMLVIAYLVGFFLLSLENDIKKISRSIDEMNSEIKEDILAIKQDIELIEDLLRCDRTSGNKVRYLMSASRD